PQEEFFIPHLAERVRQEHKKFLSQKRKLYLSVDRKIQIYALELVKQHMFFVKEKNVNDAALLVLENSSGKILAYVGGSGEFSEAKYVDNILTRRQAGSTLKPFLYALAFEKNILTPESILNDTPTEFQTERGVYKPGNYQNSFFGKVSVKKALASSLNIPAVKTLSLVGERDFNITLKSLGFSNLENPEFYGLSAALGSPDISLEELTNAYRVLANRGKYSPVHYLRESKQEKYSMVFSVQSSELISEILSSRENRALTFGLENPLSTRFWSAVKTGTSKDMRDNWCIGYTKDYTVGVWVGNSSGKPMWNVSGVTGAAPLWIDMVNWLSSRKHPNSLSENTTINSTNENEQKKAIPKIPFQNGIETPVDNTIIAIDPDIPDENQRVFFKSVFPDPSSYWYLNGKKLGDASSTYFWKPERGSFTLELYTKDKQLLSRVSFSVR
ncbi:MAG: penicillin-binding protein 1C, partial [Leptospiraceae bacterium]|nr:penicillin-binding protein 1C [Leptospiraceae bacterium]